MVYDNREAPITNPNANGEGVKTPPPEPEEKMDRAAIDEVK